MKLSPKRIVFRIIAVLIIVVLWFVTRSWNYGGKGSAEVTHEATATASIDSTQEKEQKTVLYVLDGDTVVLADGKTVRYIGVDSPEIKHKEGQQTDECFGREAAAYNKSLVEGKEVTLVRDVSQTDIYGRLLRYVYVGDELVNDMLVKNGYAKAVTFTPDVAFRDVFEVSQREARESNRGLWGECR